MEYHYLDSDNQPGGPASLDEIRALARDGKIPADPMVAAEGATEWKSLSRIAPEREVTTRPAPAVPGNPLLSGTWLASLVGGVVKVIARALSAGMVEAMLRWARTVGHFSVFGAAAFTLIYGVVAARRVESYEPVLVALSFVVGLAVAQYAAVRFLSAGEALIASTPSRFSSLAFLECGGLLAMLVAVTSLVGGVVTAVRVEQVWPLLPALLSAVFWLVLGSIGLHPQIVGVQSGQGSAGEEAIGLVAFVLKALLKLVPLAFGLVALLGSVAVLVCIFSPTSTAVYVLRGALSRLPAALPAGPGFFGAAAVLQGCLLPFAAYFLFLLANLPIELWRAILSLPGKLETLRK